MDWGRIDLFSLFFFFGQKGLNWAWNFAKIWMFQTEPTPIGNRPKRFVSSQLTLQLASVGLFLKIIPLISLKTWGRSKSIWMSIFSGASIIVTVFSVIIEVLVLLGLRLWTCFLWALLSPLLLWANILAFIIALLHVVPLVPSFLWSLLSPVRLSFLVERTWKKIIPSVESPCKFQGYHKRKREKLQI